MGAVHGHGSAVTKDRRDGRRSPRTGVTVSTAASAYVNSSAIGGILSLVLGILADQRGVQIGGLLKGCTDSSVVLF